MALNYGTAISCIRRDYRLNFSQIRVKMKKTKKKLKTAENQQNVIKYIQKYKHTETHTHTHKKKDTQT